MTEALPGKVPASAGTRTGGAIAPDKAHLDFDIEMQKIRSEGWRNKRVVLAFAEEARSP